MNTNALLFGDCLELMMDVPSKSIDMILCDLPYGTTSCKWDAVIPLKSLWLPYERIIKDNGAIVLNASQPFTSALISSNYNNFHYTWVWKKTRPSGFANAKKMPLRITEDVCIFYKKPPTYNPQGIIYAPKVMKNSKSVGGDTVRGDTIESSGKGSLRTGGKEYIQEYTNYPNNLLEFQNETGLHPTQKPVALFEYMIKTYTNEGELVLDNCAGSGTTAIACLNANRKYICMEKDEAYFEIMKNRVNSHIESLMPTE